MLTLLGDLAWLALLVAALWAPGDGLVRVLGDRCPAAARGFPATFGLGMGLWSLGLFALASSHGLVRPVLGALVGLGAAWGTWRLARFLAGWRPFPARRWRVAEGIAAASAVAAVAVVLELAAFPTLAWDEAVYHLRLPALYLREGRFAAPRFLFCAHWPQGMEMLYAVALLLRGPALAKLLHAACGIVLAFETYRLARRASPPAAAMGAALLVAASPLVLWEARTAYVDLAVALYVLLAFGALLRAGEDEQRRAHLLLAGVFLGFAAGVKLTAWTGALALGALWLIHALRRRERRREALPGLVLIGLPALVVAAPWHLKSWIETGNPVYPLLYSVFGGADWSADLAARATAWNQGIGMGRSPADFALLPLRVFALGGKGYDRFDGELGVYWLAVAAFAVWAGRRSRLARWSLAAGALLFVLWAAGPQQARFLLPLLALLALAAAAAVGERSHADGWRRLRQAFALAASALVVVAAAPLALEAGRHLQARRQAGPHLQELLAPAQIRFLEASTPADAKVLFLNNNRVYPLTREAVADTTFEASQIAEWLRPLRSAAEVDETLRRERFTHVLWERVDWGIDWPRPLLDLLADPHSAPRVWESPDGRFTVYALAPL